ncbi:MAG TPA: carbohydrate kinase family protein, partial [Spirochaetia bacterium]
GALTSLDMSLPDPSSPSGRIDWSAFLARVLPRVDLFVPSVEELLFMTDKEGFRRLSGVGGGDAVIRAVTFGELRAMADAALALGPKAILIKIGDRGAYLRTSAGGVSGLRGWESRELYTPVFSVPDVAGTTGAGDSTIAGFLASVTRGLAPEEALTMAVAVGGCCVEAPDATSGIRPWEKTVERVRSGWKRAPATVTESGWTSEASGLWRGPKDGR